MSPLDLQLLQEKIARSGDELAFEKLYHYFFAPLYHFSRLYTGSKEESEEVVQDVFTRIWKNRETLELVRDIRLYLYTCVRNTSLNYRNSRKHFQEADLPNSEILFSACYNADQKLLSGEMIRHLNAAISQIPPRSRMVFKLVKEDGLQHKEVAELLNISVRTVEKQVALALKYIGKAIGLRFSDSK